MSSTLGKLGAISVGLSCLTLAATATATAPEGRPKETTNSQCGVYFAPSTIPGMYDTQSDRLLTSLSLVINTYLFTFSLSLSLSLSGAGFGIFAGVAFDPGEEVTPGDLVVPYLDMPWHNGVFEDDELGFLWNEYVLAQQCFWFAASSVSLI